MPAAIATASRKRKQPEDMDDSPPKRVTRARAAKPTAAMPEKTTRTRTVTTASARAAAISKTSAKTTRAPSKQPVKAAEAEEQDDTEVGAATEVEAVKKGRGRPRKEVESKKIIESAKATRTRQVRTNTEKVAEKPATRTRARTGTSTISEEATSEPARKTTRAAAKPTVAGKEMPATKKITLKKKVTFEDENRQDKENVPLPAESKQTSAKATGMRAKPVRKVPAVKATATKASTAKSIVTKSARGRKAPMDNADEKTSGTPLSPKKVKQIAKSVSSGSEDELCDRPPVRALSRSPMKRPVSVRNTVKLTRKETREQAPTPTSSSQNDVTPLLQSPAKRPPPSPFKDAIRSTPKKPPFPDAISRTEVVSGQSLFKDSIKASPKKMPLPGPLSQSSSMTSTSPLKVSLLKSPAKRPVSPEKLSLFNSPSKLLRLSPSKQTLGCEATPFGLPTITPQRLFISPPSYAEAEEILGPVNQAVLSAGIEDVDESGFIEGTPAKVAFAQYRENPLAAYEAQSKKAEIPVDSALRQSETGLDSEDELLAGTPTLAALKNASTPGLKTSSRRETLGITPLALKLSSWSSSSPVKMGLASSIQEEAGTPTIASSPTQSDCSVIHHEDVTGTKPSFFDDEMLVTEQESTEVQVGETGIVYNLSSQPLGASDEPQEADPDEEADIAEDPNTDISSEESVIQATPKKSIIKATPEKTITSTSPAHSASNHSSQDTISVLEDSFGAPIALPEEEVVDIDSQDFDFMQEVSQASQEYGDENAIPIDPRLFEQFIAQPTAAPQTTQAESSMVTPARAISRPREVHTVCKVPLRDEGVEGSPIKTPRKRSKSIGAAPLNAMSMSSRPPLPGNDTVVSYSAEEDYAVTTLYTSGRASVDPNQSPRKVSYETSVINAMMTPQASAKYTPVRSVRKGADAQILRGAVVHVDVHTSEGADASSLFVELLSQMGARCVKQWSWNSRNSTPGVHGAVQAPKIGITHVVFKDGSKRTLQKVREAKGEVLCVGVGWVLE